MRGKLALLAVAVCLLTPGLAGTGLRPFTVDDLMAVRQVRDPQISPDQSRVVYAVVETDARANLDRSNLWLVPASGGPPVGLTHRGENERRARWSPDGGSIAFLSDRDSLDEQGSSVKNRSQIWILSLAGGEARQVTASPTAVSEFAWAPDGKRIVFVAPALPADHQQREARRKQGFDEIVAGEHRMSHLWTADVETGAIKRLTDGNFHAGEVAWSPKGDLVAFVSRPTPVANEQLLSDVYVVPASGGAPRKVVTNDGPDFAPAWSPDGNVIAYLSNPRRQSSGGQATLMAVSASGGTPRALLTDFDASADAPRWSAGGKTLVFTAGTRTESHIYTVPSTGGKPRAVTSGPAVYGAFDVPAGGTRLVYVRQDALAPGDIWTSSLDSPTPAQRLTNLNPQVAEIQLATTEVFTWKGADGWDIEGVLVKPPGFEQGKRYPLIVEPHGGPHGAQVVGFNTMWQCLASRGFVVLAPNFRGSTGYGQAFVDADRNDWGGKDYVDIMNGVDAAVAAGFADPERLGIEGWSYGGFMTSWVIGQTPRFKAAVAGAAVTNLQSFYGTTDIQRFIEWEFHGFPWNNPAAIRDHSPVTFAHKAKTPTLILHGNDDVRVPVEQGQQLHKILEKSGVTVEFVRYPREGHGLREPAHRRDRLERTIAWFERFLGAGTN